MGDVQQNRRRTTMTTTPTYVGIDVAKDHLDVAIRPSGECQRVANDERGIEYVVSRLREVRPSLVVLEPTGGLEQLLAAALATAGVPVAVVNPRQVREFARAVASSLRPTPSTSRR
jgi:transposase